MGGIAYHTDGTPIADWSSIGMSIVLVKKKLKAW
jgi:hypothetical protein